MANAYNWYSQLKKPKWAPPSWLFAPVWTALYILIAVSFGYAGWMFFKGEIGFLILLPFILNLIFNFSFTTLQFRFKNNYLAAIDILLVLGTLIWAMFALRSLGVAGWIAYINIPYLIWVSFATLLQLTVTYLNR